MAEVVLSTSDLVVLSGPSSVLVNVDFGAKGDRGSNIYTGLGNPNSFGTILPTGYKVHDFFIDLLTSSTTYLHMFEYISAPGGNVWEDRVILVSDQYKDSSARTFENGTLHINVPLNQVTSAPNVTTLTSADFNIQCTVANTNAVASAVSVADVSLVNNLLSLPITIKAAEFDGTDWMPLSGEKIVYLFITMV